MSICAAAEDIFVPIKIDENNLYDGVFKLLEIIRPNWMPNNIKLKTLTDGITNKLVSCQYLEQDEKEIILVRIYGNKTDLFIDRTAEIRNIKTLNVLGLAPKIYGVFENGLSYQYFPGNTLDVESVRDDKIWPLVAKQMGKMHKVQLGVDVEREPFIWNKIEQFLSLLPEPYSSEIKQIRFAKTFNSVTKLRIEYERLKSYLSKTESPIVFAHNDLLLGNVIYNKDERKVYFIDYEYAAYGYQAFDIANHFNEFVGLSIEDIDYDKYPSEEFQRNWVKIYLSEYLEVECPSEEQISKVLVDIRHHSLLSHFLWGIWSLVQYEHSDIDFDFGRYADIRLKKYFDLKDNIFKELS